MDVLPITFKESLEKTKRMMRDPEAVHNCKVREEVQALLATDVAPEELAGFLKGLFVAEGVLRIWQERTISLELMGCTHEVVHLINETTKKIEAKSAEDFEFPKTIGG